MSRIFMHLTRANSRVRVRDLDMSLNLHTRLRSSCKLACTRTRLLTMSRICMHVIWTNSCKIKTLSVCLSVCYNGLQSHVCHALRVKKFSSLELTTTIMTFSNWTQVQVACDVRAPYRIRARLRGPPNVKKYNTALETTNCMWLLPWFSRRYCLSHSLV